MLTASSHGIVWPVLRRGASRATLVVESAGALSARYLWFQYLSDFELFKRLPIATNESAGISSQLF
jgi:hypothetical protein